MRLQIVRVERLGLGDHGDLNLTGTVLAAVTWIGRVDLSPETQELLALAPEGGDLRRLHRLLLQDAFPEELSRPRSRR